MEETESKLEMEEKDKDEVSNEIGTEREVKDDDARYQENEVYCITEKAQGPTDEQIREMITQAEARGEIRGRNARIAELMREIHDSDGIPHPGSGSSALRNSRPSSIFDLAKYAK